ncbi:glycosyl transferase family 1 [Lamprobacter modestohalophilus]|uniref:Glycosyl transferase family 1 n=1 Tax=Lamprobacter modestohalophilus TaxID=1064514 RepID=A0A9X1B2Y1_9GAMM|nr:glycosyltransferase [Lamprobacter modestohalophilus]MBK1617116.1 glycosyl transferase family 1 [Lamprobacter modestohalophilus]
MRLLMISDVYFPRVNGVSTSIQTVGRELVQKGHQVTLIAPSYGEATQDPFEVIRIPSRYLPFDPEDRIMRWGLLPAHRAALRAQRFDLVHIHTPFVAHYAGLALARWLALPVVESYHTFFEQYLDKYIPLVPSAWLRYAARRFSAAQCNDVDALAVPSQAMLDVLTRYGIQTPAEVVPTGIDLGQFSQGDGARFRQRWGIAPSRPLLVHVGRLAFEKNCDFLLRMLVQVKAEIPDILLVIAGDGPALKRLQRLRDRLGLHEQILFTGYLARDGALEDCYSAGAGFVFSSCTETQGLVLLEALALGTPVVAIAEMGTREVLRDGAGCLIAAHEETDFAQQCVRLLREPGLRAELSARARAYARSWSAPVLTERLLAFYARTLHRAEIANERAGCRSRNIADAAPVHAAGLEPLDSEPEPKRSPS